MTEGVGEDLLAAVPRAPRRDPGGRGRLRAASSSPTPPRYVTGTTLTVDGGLTA